MPLVSPIDIAALSSPIPIPENTGGGFDSNTQQNYIAMTQGSGVTNPIGSGNTMDLIQTRGGNTMDLMPSQQFNSAAEYGSITGEALESGGANVGGLVKTEQEVIPTDIKFATQEDEILDKQETQYEDQIDEYQKAYDGDSGEQKSIKESLEAAGEEFLAQGGTATGPYSQFKAFKAFREARKGEQSGMSAARGVKREDRKADRKARKGKTYNPETGKYEKTGEKLKGKEKRLARRAQRKNRKSAFKDFKDNLEEDALVDITNLEN